MKKLIIAAAIVCAAVVSHGAAINWKTGAQIKPDGTTMAAANTLSLCVFLVDSKTYTDTAIGDIWGTYGKSKVADLKSSATYSNTGAGSTGVTVIQPAGDVAASTTYYALILTAYDQNNDGVIDMYAANKTSTMTNTSGSQTSTGTTSNLAKKIGGTSSEDVTWTAVSVPEPTSGLLLLLGVAGMALKRKRA